MSSATRGGCSVSDLGPEHVLLLRERGGATTQHRVGHGGVRGHRPEVLLPRRRGRGGRLLGGLPRQEEQERRRRFSAGCLLPVTAAESCVIA
jgi:hypothetical protein